MEKYSCGAAGEGTGWGGWVNPLCVCFFISGIGNWISIHMRQTSKCFPPKGCFQAKVKPGEEQKKERQLENKVVAPLRGTNGPPTSV